MNSEMEEEEVSGKISTFTKKKIIKNIVLIALAYFLLYIAYDGLSMLQTSMNQKKGIGVISQAAVYLVFGFGSLLLPKYAIKKIGCKTAIFVGMSMYIPYVASNYYPEFHTMIPAAALLGIGGSLMWGAQSTYYNECCFRYWQLVNFPNVKQSQSSKGKNNATPFVNREYTKQSGQGNSSEFNDRNIELCNEKEFDNYQNSLNKTFNEMLTQDAVTNNHNDPVTSISFKYKASIDAINVDTKFNPFACVSNEISNSCNSATSTSKNISLDSINAMFFGFHGFVYQSCMFFSNLMSYYILNKDQSSWNVSMPTDCICGADFCNDLICLESKTLEMTSDLRYMLTTVSVSVGVFSVLLIFFFLDPLGDQQKSVKFSCELLFASVLHAKKKEQFFLIPLSLYVGMELGYFVGDYTRSYVACSLGTHRVGQITMVFGVAAALASSLCGITVKLIGRIPVFLIGLGVDIATSIILLLWKPNPEEIYMFYITATMFGIFTGIFWSQVVAFYGILFREDQEAAFGFHYLCNALGSTLSFAYNDYLCSYIKIYALLAVIMFGLAGYVKSERLYYLKRKTEANENSIPYIT